MRMNRAYRNSRTDKEHFNALHSRAYKAKRDCRLLEWHPIRAVSIARNAQLLNNFTAVEIQKNTVIPIITLDPNWVFTPGPGRLARFAPIQADDTEDKGYSE